MWRLLFTLLVLTPLVMAASCLRADDEKPAAVKPNAEPAKETPAPFDYDRQLLREARIGTDSKSLLEYLRKLSPKDLEPVDFPALFQQLGDKSFEKRQQASKKLAAFDLVPSGPLIDAIYGPDKEVARRAQDLADKQAKNSDWFLPLAVVRQLIKENPPGTLEVLLRFLPFAAWEDLIEEIWYAIDGLAVQNGKVDDLLLNALHDLCPARREVSGCIIGRVGNATQKAEVVKMLDDHDTTVRLRVAQGLLASGDQRGIPTLVDLLNHKSTEISWQAEELLHWFAGDAAPKEAVGAGTEKERKECTAAWKRWLAGFAANKKDAQAQKHRRPGLLLISEKARWNDPTRGKVPGSRIWLCGCDGSKRWELTGLQEYLSGFQLVSPNYLLVAQRFRSSGNRFTLELVDLLGKASSQRRFRDFDYFHTFPNSATIIVDSPMIMVVSGAGQEVSRVSLEKDIYAKLFATYGNSLFFVAETRKPPVQNRLIQINPSTGKVLNSFSLPKGRQTLWPFTIDFSNRVLKLRNGDLFLAGRLGNGPRITGRDNSGKTFWEAFTPSQQIEQIGSCYTLISFGFSVEKRDLDSEQYRVDVLKGGNRLVNNTSSAKKFSFEFLGSQNGKAKAAIPALVEMLSDPAEEIWRSASYALIKIGPTGVPEVSKLLSSPNVDLRVKATRILGQYCQQEKKLLPAIRAGQKDESGSVRAAFYESLGRFKEQSVDLLDLLSQGLKDEDVGVRKKAIEAVESKERAAVPLIPQLIHILKGDEKELHQSAARALGGVAPQDNEVRKVLLQALQNQSSLGSQIGAAEAFAKIGPSASEAIPVLIDLVRKAPKKSPPKIGKLEGMALYALEHMGPRAQGVLPLVVDILKDRRYSADDRVGACVAIREIGVPDKEALRILEAIERDESEPYSLRFNAGMSLSKLGKEK